VPHRSGVIRPSANRSSCSSDLETAVAATACAARFLPVGRFAFLALLGAVYDSLRLLSAGEGATRRLVLAVAAVIEHQRQRLKDAAVLQ
jgi:hypothetical protein